mmetsp:Transcript_2528/g.6729  ORF Transcript_2528/g.6729 Transcript_2528/m.6729 type:complete len:322 (+) Transcript_2528:273-1238(+)
MLRGRKNAATMPYATFTSTGKFCAARGRPPTPSVAPPASKRRLRPHLQATTASRDKNVCPATGRTRTPSVSPPASNTAAAPMPEPMHIDTTPKRAPRPRRRISCSSVAVMRAPVQPSGWPSAMAPPLGLTFASSMPRCFTQYVACDANASLISYTSMSSSVRPACATAAGMATAGPTPMILGSTPTAANERNTPRMGRPRRTASRRVISNVAAAPSVSWLALPGVVDPPFLKTVGSLARLSIVVLARMPSSALMVTAFSSPDLGSTILVWTGTISSLNLPAACAAAALRWLATANASCTCLDTPNFSATFSLVTPIGMRQP